MKAGAPVPSQIRAFLISEIEHGVSPFLHVGRCRPGGPGGPPTAQGWRVPVTGSSLYTRGTERCRPAASPPLSRCSPSPPASASPPSAARSRTSATSAPSTSCGGSGSTRRPTPTWWRSASSCPAPPAARSASRSASCAPACSAGWPPGSASRCRRRSRWCCSPRRRRLGDPARRRLAARAQGRRGGGGGAGGLGHGAHALPRSRRAATLAIAAALIVLPWPSARGQVGVIVAGRR